MCIYSFNPLLFLWHSQTFHTNGYINTPDYRVLFEID